MQVWLGYQQSLRACQSGLTLNVDTASTVFLSAQPMMQYLMNHLGVGEQGLVNMTQDVFRKASNAVKNTKVGV